MNGAQIFITVMASLVLIEILACGLLLLVLRRPVWKSLVVGAFHTITCILTLIAFFLAGLLGSSEAGWSTSLAVLGLFLFMFGLWVGSHGCVAMAKEFQIAEDNFNSVDPPAELTFDSRTIGYHALSGFPFLGFLIAIFLAIAILVYRRGILGRPQIEVEASYIFANNGRLILRPDRRHYLYVVVTLSPFIWMFFAWFEPFHLKSYANIRLIVFWAFIPIAIHAIAAFSPKYFGVLITSEGLRLTSFGRTTNIPWDSTLEFYTKPYGYDSFGFFLGRPGRMRTHRIGVTRRGLDKDVTFPFPTTHYLDDVTEFLTSCAKRAQSANTDTIDDDKNNPA